MDLTFDRFIKYFSLKEIFLQELRGKWGKHVKKYRNRSEIANLHVLTRNDAQWRYVDDSTWKDLDMDDLFDRLDNTTTAIGQQYLYRQLRTYELDEEELENQYHIAEFFRSNDAQREQVQLNMWKLRSSNSSVLAEMLFGKLPEGDFPRVLAWCLAFISILTIVIALLFNSYFWLPIIPILANFIFAEAYSHRIGRHSMSFVYLRELLTVAERLSRIELPLAIRQFEYLSTNRKNVRSLGAIFRIVGLDSTSTNLVLAQLAYFMNLICLFDFLVFMRCSKRLAEHRQALCSIYFSVASIDSAISVASYMTCVGHHCCPTFTEDTEINFELVTHPLLNKAVANDYTSDGTSALITGSNMAGKSTFIKTIGTNLILAQTLSLCHAKSAKVPKIPVVSSIKRTDSLEHGKSYYFAEIEALLYLIERRSSGRPHVFLIDEILHGTNTIERIASSTAILETLSQGNIVMVTSHDVELTQLLSHSYRSFHFQETSDIEYMFDYKLHEGHSTTRNAIKLLEAIGFPANVISRARSVAQTLKEPTYQR